MLVLELLGTLSLRSETLPVPVSAQQKRPLGLLAILALGGSQGLGRSRIEAFLWPDSSDTAASHALDQTVYTIRHSLGTDFILVTGRDLRLNPESVSIDVWEFDDAIRAKDWSAAAGIYKGPLLEGFHFGGSSDLESWIDSRRSRLRLDYQTALEMLARLSAESGDKSQSVAWLRKLASSDPLSAAATKKLMLALGAEGDRAGAVRHARLYQELVRQELEMEPDPEIDDLARTLSAQTVARTPAPIQTPTPPQIPTSEARVVLPVTSSITLPPRAEKKRGYREKSALYAVLTLAAVMLGAGIWGWVRPASAKPVLRSTLLVDSSEAIAGGVSWMGRLALSPDGSLLAYINGPHWRLLLRPRNQLHATVVPGTESVQTPFFSTDGRHVGFVSGWKLWVAPVDGGAPVAIADTLIGAAGASWGPDNFIYLDGAFDSGLLRVEATRGAKPKWFTVLDTASGEIDHTWPDVLPNGKGVVFTVAFRKSSGTEERSSHSIAVAEIPSGKHRVIINDAMYPRYSTSGHLLYVTANKTLMVVPFDQNSMKVTGTPVALAEGMRLGVLGSADLAVSATGTLIYATGAGEGKWEAAWVTRDGKIKPVDPEWQGGFLGFPALSPDGKRLAASRNATTEPFHIWIKQLDRGPSVKLTFDGAHNVGSEWTPDGKSLTFSSDREGGTFALWTKPVDGKGQPVLEFREKRNVYEPRWSPDRKWLVFETDREQSGAGDILGIRPGIDSTAVSLVATRFAELCPALSPDGHWLAYSSNETGDFEVYVVPFPNTASGKWAISTSGGIMPLWSHRGNELFYLDAAANMVVAELKTKPAFSVVGSKALFPAGDFGESNFAQQYSVAPDDKRFLMFRTLEPGTPDKLIVVDNWFEELRSKSH